MHARRTDIRAAGRHAYTPVQLSFGCHALYTPRTLLYLSFSPRHNAQYTIHPSGRPNNDRPVALWEQNRTRIRSVDMYIAFASTHTHTHLSHAWISVHRATSVTLRRLNEKIERKKNNSKLAIPIGYTLVSGLPIILPSTSNATTERTRRRARRLPPNWRTSRGDNHLLSSGTARSAGKTEPLSHRAPCAGQVEKSRRESTDVEQLFLFLCRVRGQKLGK